jgi:hypothetical protein
MTDLLPCPFCGDSAKLRFFGGTVDVECTNCNAKSALFGTQSDGEGKAIAAWNTRALTRLSVTKVNAAELAAGSLGRQSDSQVSDDAVVERAVQAGIDEIVRVEGERENGPFVFSYAAAEQGIRAAIAAMPTNSARETFA